MFHVKRFRVKRFVKVNKTFLLTYTKIPEDHIEQILHIDPAHQPVQRIDFADQMPLAQATDRRIAGHRTDGRKAMRDQYSHASHARSGAGSLATGVAASNDNDVERFRWSDHAGLLSRSEETRKT